MSWVGIMNICIPIAEMCRDSESVCEINYQINWFKSATLVGRNDTTVMCNKKNINQ